MFIFEKSYLLYNSLSNSFAELDSGTYEALIRYKGGDDVSVDEDLLSDLQQIKAVVVNDDIEFYKIKYSTLKKRYISNTLLLTITPTLGCNFKCPYCFEKEHSHKKIMSESIENDIVSLIKKSGKSRVVVTWFGGEPLLGFNSIKRLTAKILNFTENYNASIITNGYLLNDKVVRQLSNLRINEIQITLDGCADVHDARRCLKNGGKTFDTIISNIKRVNDLSPNTKINIRVNLDKTNVDYFTSLYCYLTALNCKNLSIFPAFVSDSTEEKANPCVCNTHEQFSFISDCFKQKGLVVFPFFPSSNRTECAVRNINSFVIGPDGELYKCWQDVGNIEKIFGNISGEVTNEAILSEYLLAGDPFDDEECKTCLLLPICSGGCPYERIKNIKDPTTKKPCPLIKHKLSEFLAMHYQSKHLNSI